MFGKDQLSAEGVFWRDELHGLLARTRLFRLELALVLQAERDREWSGSNPPRSTFNRLNSTAFRVALVPWRGQAH